MKSIRTKEKFTPLELCAKQRKTNNAIIPSKQELKKRKGVKNCLSFFFFFRNKTESIKECDYTS